MEREAGGHLCARAMGAVTLWGGAVPAAPNGLFARGPCTPPSEVHPPAPCSGVARAHRNAYKRISEISDVMLCEGTGHVAVGSIVNMNNAKVAAMIGADIVLIANGGLGSAFDDLELNRMVCQHHGVRIAGVVVNRVAAPPTPLPFRPCCPPPLGAHGALCEKSAVFHHR